MKTGKTLTQLAIEIEAQAKAKKDFVVDTRTIKVETEKLAFNSKGDRIAGAPVSRVVIPDHGNFSISDVMHQQLAESLKIPKKYYDGMREAFPDLLDHNVNYLFNHAPDTRMIRSFDRGETDRRGRAYLSNRFNRLDNDTLLMNALPILNEYKNDLRVESCEVTERKLYLKMIFPKIEREVSKGDIVQAGAVISNSEIGLGSISIEKLIYTLACTNGMIIANSGIRKHHVGKQVAGDETQLLFSDETLRADDKAFWLKIRDVLLSTINEAHFDLLVNKLRESREKKIEAINPARSVEVLGNKFLLSQTEVEQVAGHFIKSSEFSLYGLANAITRASQDVPSYDRATELEKLGGNLIDISATDWKDISRAALVIG